MFRRPHLPLIVALSCAGLGHALEQASGVNLTADEGFGARHLGMALTRAGFGKGADAVVNAPASMNDVNDFSFTTAHAEQFGLARFDNFAMIVPWHAQSTLGFGVARYAVSGIEQRGEATELPTTEPDALFDASDWVVTGSFARRFPMGYNAVDVAGSVHLLRRQLDQAGMGMRGDAMAQYTYDGRLRAGAHVRGIVPSMARWESGYSEYEAPEAVLFVAMRKEVPYFYGSLQAGFETPGLLQPGARSVRGEEGARAITDPGSALATSKVGAEFNFDFGLSLRAGFDELAPSAWTSSVRLGMGYDWRGILAVDYAFAAHPYLGESHRIALRFTPSFPRFEGRNFRPGATASVPRERLRPVYPSPHTPGDAEVAPDTAPSRTAPTPAPAPVAPAPSSPAPAPEPAKAAPNADSSPRPAAPAGTPEVLEDGEVLEH
jgi:hypothetical protein